MSFSFANEPGQVQKKNCKLAAEIEGVTPKLSIVTPYYNSEANFEQTFYCIMNQSFEEFEWVIVNDGSTRPEAVETLEAFAAKDARIRVVHQENGGQSKAKNHGIRESHADIIVFLDADDLVEPFWLALLYKALERHQAAAWAYTDLVGFGAEEYVWTKPFSAGRMTFNNVLVNAGAFRKKALESVGLFPEIAKHYDEDWALYLLLLQKGYHPVHIPVIGFWYRKSASGMQQTVRKNDELRKQSDEYVKKLAQNVDIHIKSEEYGGKLPKTAEITQVSGKEKVLKTVLSTRLGVAAVKKLYNRNK